MWLWCSAKNEWIILMQIIILQQVNFILFLLLFLLYIDMCMVHVVHRIWKLFFFSLSFRCCCFVYYMNNKVQQNSFKKVNKCKENTRNMIDDRKYVLDLWIFIMLLCLEINKMCIFMLIHLISYLKKIIFFILCLPFGLFIKWRYMLEMNMPST